MFLDSVSQLSGGELALLRTMPPLMKSVDATVVLAEEGPLVDRLRGLGATVIVLELDASVRTAKRDRVTPRGVSLKTFWLLLQHVLRLSKLIRDLNPDIVHTNSLKSALYGGLAARLARKPVVWHVRDRIAPDYLPLAAVYLVRCMARVVPTGLIANSHATLATVRGGREPRARLGQAVISSPVVFDSVSVESPLARRVTQGVVFGLVGRISPWKGQDVFLRAFALAFAGTDAQARIIGSAMFGEEEYEASLRSLVDDLGISEQVVFRGFRTDVVSELAALDIAVHASTLPEPFGQVVLEAMAIGIPIIASAEGGPSEILTNGVDGVLVQPRDPAALAEAMTALAGDEGLRQSLRAAGLKTAARYTPERTAEGILEVYSALLSSPSRWKTSVPAGRA